MRLRALVAAAGIEARRTLAYRVDFWVQAVVVFLSEFGLVWFVWTGVYASSGRTALGGMTHDAAILYYVAVILSAKLVRSNDMGDGTVSGDVYEGGLSKYLLYPTGYLPMKYAQQLGGLLPALLQLVVFGAVFPFVFAPPDAHVTAASLLRGVVSLAAANVLYFLMASTLHAFSFWAENVWSLLVLLRFVSSLLGGLLVPLDAWPAGFRPSLAALPFRHFFSEPALTMIGRRGPDEWPQNLAVCVAWSLGFALVLRLVFARGRLRYTGPGM